MTTEAAEKLLLSDVKRCAQQFERGLITSDEMVGKLFDYFASDSNDLTYLAPQIVGCLPGITLPIFWSYVESALKPEYRKPAWHFGGITEEAERQETLRLTSRVRAWATQLKSTHS